MRSRCTVGLLLCLTPLFIWGQRGTNPDQPTLTVRSTLVQVPVLVKNKAGRVVFELTADDFLVTDNGLRQSTRLDVDTDSQPLALAIVVETGGAGVLHLGDYGQLDPVLDALIGNVEHRVAVVNFDSAPHLLVPFSSRTADISRALADLNEGDNGAAILDGIAFAIEQLRVLPPRYRRAILLLSETVDQGSKTKLDEALRLMSNTNTAMYSFSFSSTRAAVSTRHRSSIVARPVPPTVASVVREPIVSTMGTITSKCWTALASLRLHFVWPPCPLSLHAQGYVLGLLNPSRS